MRGDGPPAGYQLHGGGDVYWHVQHKPVAAELERRLARCGHDHRGGDARVES
jgi:hypothetical protein